MTISTVFQSYQADGSAIMNGVCNGTLLTVVLEVFQDNASEVSDNKVQILLSLKVIS